MALAFAEFGFLCQQSLVEGVGGRYLLFNTKIQLSFFMIFVEVMCFFMVLYRCCYVFVIVFFFIPIFGKAGSDEIKGYRNGDVELNGCFALGNFVHFTALQGVYNVVSGFQNPTVKLVSQSMIPSGWSGAGVGYQIGSPQAANNKSQIYLTVPVCQNRKEEGVQKRKFENDIFVAERQGALSNHLLVSRSHGREIRYQGLDENECSGNTAEVIEEITKKKDILYDLSTCVIDGMKNTKEFEYNDLMEFGLSKSQRKGSNDSRRRLNDVIAVMIGLGVIEEKKWKVGGKKVKHYKWRGRLHSIRLDIDHELIDQFLLYYAYEIAVEDNESSKSWARDWPGSDCEKIKVNRKLDSWLCSLASKCFFDMEVRGGWSGGLRGFSEQLSLYLGMLSLIALRVINEIPECFYSTYVSVENKCLSKLFKDSDRRRIYDILPVLRSLGILKWYEKGVWVMDVTNPVLQEITEYCYEVFHQDSVI